MQQIRICGALAAPKSLFEFGIRNAECGISGGKGQKGLNPNSLSPALFG